MSASLVGSEMCIRDSRGTSTRPRIGIGHPHSGGCQPRWWRARRTGQAHLCLLYTSDAADDM
eukprot:1691424-Alexandrium_andersonii.AAC.1